jgi:hypothetical protein
MTKSRFLRIPERFTERRRRVAQQGAEFLPLHDQVPDLRRSSATTQEPRPGAAAPNRPQRQTSAVRNARNGADDGFLLNPSAGG